MQQAKAAAGERSVAYTVTREYQLSAAGAPRPSSNVVAQVSFIPPSAKQYVIVKAEGSERGAGIVRKVLDHEAGMARHAAPNDISRQNYDFALLGRESLEGRGCYVLQLSPKRNAVDLVRGKAWVDAQNFLVRRVEGDTAKSPSFWIKKLVVTLNYGQVNGVWVQTSTQAVADVRLAGTHVLTSRDLDVQAATFSARSQPPSQLRGQRRGGRHTVADAATWLAR